MATISKLKPSGSTSGRPIKVVAIATAGTIFHTAHATDLDEIWAWLTNTSASDVTVTCEFGGVTSPDDFIKEVVPAGGSIPFIPGIPLTGGLVCRMFASVANVVTAWGFVNRISG